MSDLDLDNGIRRVITAPRFPASRYRADCTEGSAEEFRDDVLIPIIKQGRKVVVSLGDMAGMPASWSEEVFGGLVRKLGRGVDLQLIGPAEWVNEAQQFMDEERERQAVDTKSIEAFGHPVPELLDE